MTYFVPLIFHISKYSKNVPGPYSCQIPWAKPYATWRRCLQKSLTIDELSHWKVDTRKEKYQIPRGTPGVNTAEVSPESRSKMTEESDMLMCPDKGTMAEKPRKWNLKEIRGFGEKWGRQGSGRRVFLMRPTGGFCAETFGGRLWCAIPVWFLFSFPCLLLPF